MATAPDSSAIEKIRIVFTVEPLAGFGLVCDLLSAMAFAANCNFTIDSCSSADKNIQPAGQKAEREDQEPFPYNLIS